jgi:hypothetical protein
MSAKPKSHMARRICASGYVDAVAEELVAEVPLFQGNVANDHPPLVVVAAPEEAATNPEQGAPANAGEAGAGAVAAPVRVKDCSPKLEVREARVVDTQRRPLYIRKVLDECKAKFGTPKPTEANTRAVWHFAHRVMKNHGVRPSHIAEMIPYVVQLTFVESEAELRAGIVRGAYKQIINGQFDEHLSRMERWIRKLKQAFGMDC